MPDAIGWAIEAEGKTHPDAMYEFSRYATDQPARAGINFWWQHEMPLFSLLAFFFKAIHRACSSEIF